MSFISALIDRVHRHDEGQGLAEYELIPALIAIVAISALIFLRTREGKTELPTVLRISDTERGSLARSSSLDGRGRGQKRHVPPLACRLHSSGSRRLG
jgi:Flp pilus assembly pilin Flp